MSLSVSTRVIWFKLHHTQYTPQSRSNFEKVYYIVYDYVFVILLFFLSFFLSVGFCCCCCWLLMLLSRLFVYAPSMNTAVRILSVSSKYTTDMKRKSKYAMNCFCCTLNSVVGVFDNWSKKQFNFVRWALGCHHKIIDIYNSERKEKQNWLLQWIVEF